MRDVILLLPLNGDTPLASGGTSSTCPTIIQSAAGFEAIGIAPYQAAAAFSAPEGGVVADSQDENALTVRFAEAKKAKAR